MDLTVTTATDWTGAHCVGSGVEMQPSVATAEQIENAKRLCAGCPLRLECHMAAEAQGVGEHGAYGVHAGKWWGESPTLLTECKAPGCVELAEHTYCSVECRNEVRREAARVRMAGNRQKESVPA